MPKSEIAIDKVKAQEMIGKIVLVGVTDRKKKDEVIGATEYFGYVKRINSEEGLVIERGDNKEEMSLPPMLEQYEKASPSIYNLKSCDYSIENPDYLLLGQFILHLPKGKLPNKSS